MQLVPDHRRIGPPHSASTQLPAAETFECQTSELGEWRRLERRRWISLLVCLDMAVKSDHGSKTLVRRIQRERSAHCSRVNTHRLTLTIQVGMFPALGLNRVEPSKSRALLGSGVLDLNRYILHNFHELLSQFMKG